MRTSALIRRSLVYYRHTHLAVVLGVAAAVAVLTGALLVGHSVRTSLRELFLLRVGNASYLISTATFFGEELAEELQSHDHFEDYFGAACPLLALEAFVTHQESGRRASRVQLYGIDQRFWNFHGRKPRALESGQALLSPSLAQELTSLPGDSLLVGVEKRSQIPLESLHGRREEMGHTLRLTAGEVLPASALGEFSTRLDQSAVRALFLPLQQLQRSLERPGKVNTILVSQPILASTPEDSQSGSARLETLLKETVQLEDLGIRLRLLEKKNCFLLESERAVVDDALSELAQKTAARLGMRTLPLLTYLANTIRLGKRYIPYSLVTAIRLQDLGALNHKDTKTTRHPSRAPIWLSDWAAGDLGAQPGDTLSMEYYLWKTEGDLVTESAEFEVAGVIPLTTDPDLTPPYPGITDSDNLTDWDPPFPIDLQLIGPRDEEYWDQYRTTPKAFIPLKRGQELWTSRFGKLTSLRIFPPGDGTQDLPSALESFRQGLRAALDPTRMGLSVYPARARGLEASRGATDFGEYFLYFSFFLVVSALLLAGLFFRLGVEQRLREVGTLRAVGFPPARIRRLFLSEGAVLASLGSLLGILGAWGYGALILLGLRTWWFDAVGTRLLKLHLTSSVLFIGGAAGVLTALAWIAWTLRTLAPASPRSLLTGDVSSSRRSARSRPSLLSAFLSSWGGPVFSLLGLLLLLAAFLDRITETAGFFGAGTLLLLSLLCFQASWFQRGNRKSLQGNGWWTLSRLGFRDAGHRPGRSLLCIALIASATFIIVAVDAFKQETQETSLEKESGSGGFPLLAESRLPLLPDPNTVQGREALNLDWGSDSQLLENVVLTRFRLRPGDDTSCLNLYQPRNPRILAPTPDFLSSGRFTFQDSMAETDQERENPWLLLNRPMPEGTVPVIADAKSMTYVLHLKLGEDFLLYLDSGRTVRLKLVGALADSLFQAELLMSEENFLRLFATRESHSSGYRFFLLDLPTEKSPHVAALLEERLSDFGFDVVPTRERLAAFHRVENTYLSTFQTLGGLGLLLGTLGLATVLLRNVLERRRELALLRAVGYRSSDLILMVAAENALLLFFGLVTGTACALLAIAPALYSRGGQFPGLSLGLLLAVLATGLITSLIATIAALRSPLLPALRSE